MKKINLLFAIILIVGFVSCTNTDDDGVNISNNQQNQNDDNNNQNNNDGSETSEVDTSLLVGNWELVSIDYTGTGTSTVAGITQNFSYVGETVETDVTLTMTENPNNYESSGTVLIQLSTSLSGGTPFIQNSSASFEASGNWELLEDNILSMEGMTSLTNGESQSEGAGTVTILELTETTFKVKTIEDTTINENGVESTQNLEIYTVYQRIQE
ncbi:hypothetical protein [Aureivirga marina]|uniref:hypothetical protein n=1 Tax=Aureivirga marina TaxID=1182451 RepID=UPI0018CBB777|nr:hypothetical protein [Aureivirga marina]